MSDNGKPTIGLLRHDRWDKRRAAWLGEQVYWDFKTLRRPSMTRMMWSQKYLLFRFKGRAYVAKCTARRFIYIQSAVCQKCAAAVLRRKSGGSENILRLGQSAKPNRWEVSDRSGEDTAAGQTCRITERKDRPNPLSSQCWYAIGPSLGLAGCDKAKGERRKSQLPRIRETSLHPCRMMEDKGAEGQAVGGREG